MAASNLMLWFEGLFTPDEPVLAAVVNHGLAAVFWLVAGALMARLIRVLC
jgi:hypothetical protein